MAVADMRTHQMHALYVGHVVCAVYIQCSKIYVVGACMVLVTC